MQDREIVKRAQISNDVLHWEADSSIMLFLLDYYYYYNIDKCICNTLDVKYVLEVTVADIVFKNC